MSAAAASHHPRRPRACGGSRHDRYRPFMRQRNRRGGRTPVIAVRVNGELRDLAAPLADGDEVEPVELASDDGRAIMRHSTAHVLAQAVQDLFPEAKLGIGPPVENGFYYDFDVAQPFGPDDLKEIEKRMRAIVKQGQLFSRRAVSDEEARAELAGEPYKLELIGLKGGARRPRTAAERGQRRGAVEVGGAELTIYDNLDAQYRRAVLEGPVPGPARAHHPGHPGVQADAHRRRVLAGQREEPAAAADLRHRLGVTRRPGRLPAPAGGGRAARPPQARRRARPVLVSRPRSAAGLPVFHPKGGIIRRVMEDYSRQRHVRGRLRVRQHPAHHQVGPVRDLRPPGLVRRRTCSRPWSWRARSTTLKPMNCPMHILIYRSRGRSYRELPLRLFEFGTVYRFEKSGVVHGLTRVRGFTQDDAHIFCTREQLADELSIAARLRARPAARLRADRVLGLSCPPGRPEKFVGEPEDWEEATEALRSGAPWMSRACPTRSPTRAARRSTGRRSTCTRGTRSGARWQLSTLQVDFQRARAVRPRVPGGGRLPAGGRT